MSAGFKDVVEAYHVGLDMGIRVDDAVTDSCLGCEVHDNLRSELCENSLEECPVGDVALMESEAVISHQRIQALFLEARIVIGVQVIDACDGRIVDCPEDMSDEIAADKAGSTGH